MKIQQEKIRLAIQREILNLPTASESLSWDKVRRNKPARCAASCALLDGFTLGPTRPVFYGPYEFQPDSKLIRSQVLAMDYFCFGAHTPLRANHCLLTRAPGMFCC